ncbi:MAG: hypothetical protein M1837_006935 [Sclerophora amabilis]|nr:MAG: hypothetical protein M1837_006935 [Sclerophora amabilis]
MPSIDQTNLAQMNAELEKLRTSFTFLKQLLMLSHLLESSPPAQSRGVSDIPTMRAQFVERANALAESVPVDNSGLCIEDHQMRTRDGAKITVRTYIPTHPREGGSPLIVMFHGGEFCVGGLENEERKCRSFCKELGMVAVNVNYRLAPETPISVPLRAVEFFLIRRYDGTKSPSSIRLQLMQIPRADPARGSFVGGTSAGANFAAVTSHLARDENLSPPLTGVYLSVPAVLPPSVVPEKYKADYLSYEQLRNVPVLNRTTMDLFRNSYSADPNSELFTPFLWPSGHSDLPPTYFQICGMDPLRDEGFLYDKVLREEAGVKTKVDV